MTAAGLVGAVEGLFVSPSGRPVPVLAHELEPGAVADLVGGAGEQPRLVVPTAEVLAELLPGERVTGAAVVVDHGGRVTLLYASQPLDARITLVLEAVGATQDGLARSLQRLRTEAVVVDALHATGRRLTSHLDLDTVVQEATDAATVGTGAEFGAFFYNVVDQYGESYMLYTISGVPREEFSRFPLPRNTAVFAPTFDGAGTVRSPDITLDPRFGHTEPYRGMPPGHLPVRSYLAVSAISPSSGEVLGGFFFGHSEPERFVPRHEYLAEGIAAYAAIALDNARLYERERDMVRELSRSMLPAAPEVPGMHVVSRYLPAATGTNIGGDWFDVIPLAGGGTAFAIGDVVGHGVTAATIMGQIRTAIRSYALLGFGPAELLMRVSQLCSTLFDVNFATCFYAVHTTDDELVYANAGHLPAVLIPPDGPLSELGEAMAQPLGVGRSFAEERVAFPPGSDLVLYTDGLVESRTRDLDQGVAWLLAGLDRLAHEGVTGGRCDELIHELTQGRHDDDVAFLYAHYERRQP